MAAIRPRICPEGAPGTVAAASSSVADEAGVGAALAASGLPAVTVAAGAVDCEPFCTAAVAASATAASAVAASATAPLCWARSKTRLQSCFCPSAAAAAPWLADAGNGTPAGDLPAGSGEPAACGPNRAARAASSPRPPAVAPAAKPAFRPGKPAGAGADPSELIGARAMRGDWSSYRAIGNGMRLGKIH